MEGTSSNLDVFAATLIEAAKADRSILVVTSDSRGSGRLAPFAAAVAEQIVEVGIAEQNLVGISADLVAAGKKVFKPLDEAAADTLLAPPLLANQGRARHDAFLSFLARIDRTLAARLQSDRGLTRS
jgi:hypothetical protein